MPRSGFLTVEEFQKIEEKKKNFEAMITRILEFLKERFSDYLLSTTVEFNIGRTNDTVFTDYHIPLQIGVTDYPCAVMTLAFRGAFKQPFVLRLLLQYSPMRLRTDDMPVFSSCVTRLIPSKKMGPKKDESLVFTKSGDYYGIDALALDIDSRRNGLMFTDKSRPMEEIEECLRQFSIHLVASRISGINVECEVEDALTCIYKYIKAAGLRSLPKSNAIRDKFHGVDAECDTAEGRFEIQVKSNEKDVAAHVRKFRRVPVVVRHKFLGGKYLFWEDVLNCVLAAKHERVLVFSEHPIPAWLNSLKQEKVISNWFMEIDWNWARQIYRVPGWRVKVNIISPDGVSGYFYVMAMRERLTEFRMYRPKTPAFLLSENLGEKKASKRSAFLTEDEKNFKNLVRKLAEFGVTSDLLALA